MMCVALLFAFILDRRAVVVVTMSKVNPSDVKPLTAEERRTLQELHFREQLTMNCLPEYADELSSQWSLADETPSAMSDASKRRLEEYVPPPVKSDVTTAYTRVPVPCSTFAGPPTPGSPTAEVNLGSTKKGKAILLPPGVTSLSNWGETMLEFGKYGAKDWCYEDLRQNSDKDVVSYVKWCKSQADAAEGRLRDLCLFLVACDNVSGTAAQRPVIPGASEVRRFRAQ